MGGAASRGPLPGGSSPERIADATEVPPWQRGRAAKPASRPPDLRQPDAPARPERGPNSGATGHSPGVDARLNRFLSGGVGRGATAGAGRAGWAAPTRAADGPKRRDPKPRTARPPARPRAALRDPSRRTTERRTARGVRQRAARPVRARHRARRRASRAPERHGQEPASRPAGARPAECRWPAAIRARCAPACRSAGSTRGAC